MEEAGCGGGMDIGLRRECVLYRPKWIVGLNQIATSLRKIQPPSFVGGMAILMTLVTFLLLFCCLVAPSSGTMDFLRDIYVYIRLVYVFMYKNCTSAL